MENTTPLPLTPYAAALVRVVDGDTQDFVVATPPTVAPTPGSFSLPLLAELITVSLAGPATVVLSMKKRIRLTGLNCPELSTPAGQVARNYAVAWLSDGIAHAPPEHRDFPFLILGNRLDNYGRSLGTITRRSDGASLNADLLSSHNAVVMSSLEQISEW